MKAFIYNLFIQKDGIPDSIDKLIEYLDFITGYEYNGDAYTEKHHILPRVTYNEHINEDWNIVKLKYEDHIKAHELLFEAYNFRKYGRTLNFMKSDVAKNGELLSIASKKGWESLKNNKEVYEQWKKAHSEYMKGLSPEEQGRRAKKGWDKLTDEQYQERCNINKEIWTDELKEWKSNQMKQYLEENPEESSRRAFLKYKNMPPEKFNEFKSKMNDVNKDPIKREKASLSMKKQWSDPEFIEKMKNRKKKPGDVYELISPAGERLNREGLHKIVNEFNFNISLIRKYTNSNQPVSLPPNKKIINEKTANTIGWIFNKIN